MHCRRCNGQMVRERLLDFNDDSGNLYCDAWRCLNCGSIVDLLILQHRLEQPSAPYRGKARRRMGRAAPPARDAGASKRTRASKAVSSPAMRGGAQP